jgi:hypothetical protein
MVLDDSDSEDEELKEPLQIKTDINSIAPPPKKERSR